MGIFDMVVNLKRECTGTIHTIFFNGIKDKHAKLEI